jgi:hypothetical protein
MGICSYGQEDSTLKAKKKPHKSFLVEERPFTIEIPIWVPGLSGNFAYGDFSIDGEGGTDPGDPEDPDDDDEGNIWQRIFTPKFYVKFFFLTRMAYENKNFLVQFDAISGSIGESIKFTYNSKELAKLEFTTINLRTFGGYRIVDALSKKQNFRYELYAYLGARYHNHKIVTQFLDNRLIFDVQPWWIEPIVGVQNQFSLKRWFFLVQADMGGFTIDGKYSFQGTAFVYYRMGRALSLKLGWNILDLNHRATYNDEEVKMDATLSGPSVGLAIQF